jgi:hypothetical protein
VGGGDPEPIANSYYGGGEDWDVGFSRKLDEEIRRW